MCDLLVCFDDSHPREICEDFFSIKKLYFTLVGYAITTLIFLNWNKLCGKYTSEVIDSIHGKNILFVPIEVNNQFKNVLSIIVTRLTRNSRIIRFFDVTEPNSKLYGKKSIIRFIRE